MTVSTSTNSVVYRGNGATTQFAVPFKVLDEDHLVVGRRVYATGVVDYTYIGTDYSYTGIGADSGTLTLAGAALDDDYELVIERIVSYTQGLDIVNAGGFYPETVEEQLDLMVMGIQQLASLAERAAVVPIGEDGLELPAPSERANKFFAFDADGDLTMSSGTGSDAGLRTDLADTDGTSLVNFIAAGTGAVTRTAQSKLRDIIAVGDYAGMQAAYNALPASGGVVVVPGGYTETLLASLTLNKDHAGFLFLGPATITMGTNQVIVPVGINGHFIRGIGSLVGGDTHGGATGGGVMFLYSGATWAFDVGDTSANTLHLFWEGFTINTTGGAAGARPYRFRRVIQTKMERVLCRGNSGQNGPLWDGTGGSGYCGFIQAEGCQISSYGNGLTTANQVNQCTLMQCDIFGPQLGTGVGLAMVGNGNVFFGEIAGFGEGTNFSATASNNRVTCYNENNTVDVVAALNSAHNSWQAIGGAYTATDANGSTSTNDIGGGTEHGNLMLTASGALKGRTSVGVTRLMSMLGDELYIGALDQNLAGGGGIIFRNGGVQMGVLTNTFLDLKPAASELRIAGTKVVDSQQAAVPDASGGATIDTEARTAINDLLARLRAHGLIAT